MSSCKRTKPGGRPFSFLVGSELQKLCSNKELSLNNSCYQQKVQKESDVLPIHTTINKEMELATVAPVVLDCGCGIGTIEFALLSKGSCDLATVRILVNCQGSYTF